MCCLPTGDLPLRSWSRHRRKGCAEAWGGVIEASLLYAVILSPLAIVGLYSGWLIKNERRGIGNISVVLIGCAAKGAAKHAVLGLGKKRNFTQKKGK